MNLSVIQQMDLKQPSISSFNAVINNQAIKHTPNIISTSMAGEAIFETFRRQLGDETLDR